MSRYIRLYTPLFRRRLHAFSIGALKTGAASLARVFSRSIRVAHDPDTARLVELIRGKESGTISRGEVIARLRRRDRRMRQELEVSHPLVYLAEELLEAFPSARFLVTVREPRSWLVSRVSLHDLKGGRHWKLHHRHFLDGRADDFLPAEAGLAARGLVPLRAYLEQYEDHYRRVRDFLPPDRTLVVRTDRITQELPAIARFLGILPEECVVSEDYCYPQPSPAFARIDPLFVDAAIAKWCPAVVRHWFPEKVDQYAARNHPELERPETRRARGVLDPTGHNPPLRAKWNGLRQSTD